MVAVVAGLCPGVSPCLCPQDFVAGRLLITAEHEPCDSRRSLGCPRTLTVTTSRTTARLHGTGDTPGQHCDCHQGRDCHWDQPCTLVLLWQPSQCPSPCPRGGG